MSQQIRPSQFIFTYGPGAILESPSGPVLIRDLTGLRETLNNSGLSDLSRLEIHDEAFTSRPPRLGLETLFPWRIISIPSNAELSWPEGRIVYNTTAFPLWSLCNRHQTGAPILYRSLNGCPVCIVADQNEIRRKAGVESIRFVMACPKGHLSDVNWLSFVHQGAGCGKQYVEYLGGGGSIKEITTRCPDPKCPGFNGRRLVELYRAEEMCSGQHSHRPGTQSESCQEKMFLQQRGALSLFLPEVITALSLETGGTVLIEFVRRHRADLRMAMGTLTDLGFPVTSDGVAKIIQRKYPTNQQQVAQTVANIILIEWDEVLEIFNEMEGVSGPQGSQKETELERLLNSSESGAPAKALKPGNPPNFEVIKNQIRKSVPWAGPELRVVPVTRLREVAVQVGFRRMVGTDPEKNASLVTCELETTDPGTNSTWKWLPGVERRGEGIFLRFENEISLTAAAAASSRWTHWQTKYLEALESNPPDMIGPFRSPLHPVEVWWHTLSHRLIRTLSLSSGYSSSSLRERIYFEPQTRSGVARSGLLIYAVQSGGDGTLGGLTSLASNLSPLLDDSIEDLHSCSNDPLCEESATRNSDNGAACYACLYASETSCEFRNRGLDRHMLMDTLK